MTHVSLLRLRCRITAALRDADRGNDVSLLDPGECDTHQRFLIAEDRRDYAAAHALLRRTLTSLEPGHSPEAWTFARTAHGKPYLSVADRKGPPLRFSLTHTRGCVACAVSRAADIGIDAESRSHINDLGRLIEGVCSPEEQAQVLAAPVATQVPLFLDLWALKEAYLKARGTGLDASLANIAFDLSRAAMILPAFTTEGARAWWFGLFRPSPESRVALAIAPDQGAELMLDAGILGPHGEAMPIEPVRASAPHRLAATTTSPP